MSRLPQASISKGAIPKTTMGKGKTKKEREKEKKQKDVVEWQLPSFSIAPKKSKQDINWERLKKDAIRRQSPEGEDIKEIRRILREVKNIDVPVHEFIAMISAYTGDNGTTLRSVMADDLEAFRKLAKKVYETMTQDVSDVLVNEQLQMVQYYDEKMTQLSDKMMRAINAVYDLVPNFDFEKYLNNPDEYLASVLPIPEYVEKIGNEGFEMMRRQQAYHRLQWLKSEGERMSEENRRLMKRLEELKREQMLETQRSAEMAAEAEAKRQQLAQEESEKKEKLEQLNESIEKSFIRDEMQMTQQHNVTAMLPPGQGDESMGGPSVATGAVRKGSKKTRKRPDWSADTAAEIEDTGIKGAMATGATKRAPRSNIKKVRAGRMKIPPPPQPPGSEDMDEFGGFGCPKKCQGARSPSPFHFSPPKTPPGMDDTGLTSFGRPRQARPAKPPSPFHYSPPKTPPQVFTSTQIEEPAAPFGRARPAQAPRQTSPFHYSPPRSPPPPSSPRKQETKIDQASTSVQVRRPQPRVRPSRAPRDSWGGFN